MKKAIWFISCGLLGVLLGVIGHPYDTWQFWAVTATAMAMAMSSPITWS